MLCSVDRRDLLTFTLRKAGGKKPTVGLRRTLSNQSRWAGLQRVYLYNNQYNLYSLQQAVVEIEAREQASKVKNKMIEERLSAAAERETRGEATSAANTGLSGM